jgi:AcrR family transcriptional regulator
MLQSVAWNTEETKRRMKDAATEEFAAAGLHGTTMDRIAERAGVNKERLYNYFGDKRSLFATVLADELAKIAAAVPVQSLREHDVGEYAGRLFDYHASSPHLVRLLLWEALTYGEGQIPDETGRTAHYRQKVEEFAAAQRDGVLASEPQAAQLVFLVLAVADWWFAVPQLARMLTGSEGHGQGEQAARRAVVVEAARRLARA